MEIPTSQLAFFLIAGDLRLEGSRDGEYNLEARHTLLSVVHAAETSERLLRPSEGAQSDVHMFVLPAPQVLLG